ncbi:MAG: phosphatidylserine/phosphatidylglycerophosphate/cardiolipin synthase family protein [Deltaproteobacteria bacterium]|nr:phosphatidylserine/phosphatidylglycerophosphate/cardiolipin synthase family protein [Deltaproteobacteria bacterium]
MLQGVSETPPDRDRISLLKDGDEAFPAMLAAIAAAEREVTLEMYWFDDSAIGRRFVEALAERARAGVAVSVLYDAIGSLGGDRALFAPLTEAGGQVVEFNPIAPWRRRFALTRVSQRDHRKILTVDQRVGFVGGLNIGLPWMAPRDGGGGWRDDVARVEGPAVGRLRELFDETWKRQGGGAPRLPSLRRSRERLREARQEIARGAAEVSVLGQNAWLARRAIRREYLSRVRGARTRVLLENSYFLPDGATRREIQRAARRGVEVRVVVPRTSDVPAVAWATRFMYAGLLRAGVHVHEWTPSVLHAKTAVVDDWATTGSYNLDYRSLRYNLEANVASRDPRFVEAVAGSIRRDLQEGCQEVDPEAWARRPWLDRVKEGFFWLARTLL